MPTYILHTHTYTYCTVCVYIWPLAHHHIGIYWPAPWYMNCKTLRHTCSTGESLGPLGYHFENQRWSKHPTAGMFSKKWVSNCSPEEILKFAKGWTANSTTSNKKFPPKEMYIDVHGPLWWPPGPPNSVWWDTSSHQLPTSFPVCFDGNCVTWCNQPGFSHLGTFQEKWLPKGINPQKQNELWHVLISPFKKLKGNQEIHRNLCLSENKLPMATPHVATRSLLGNPFIHTDQGCRDLLLVLMGFGGPNHGLLTTFFTKMDRHML